ncbi:hypothetical protein BV898_15685 [Hypsibius exemplaris]|uniref:Uncharacterized protein n=1 Tax=Hypsibius exemplaris TaxID=2072580 RepID=A0A9X6NBQ4_HYPEX|nr:hypothetical protein BV898_15685 [Hypsibius exemplaris]
MNFQQQLQSYGFDLNAVLAAAAANNKHTANPGKWLSVILKTAADIGQIAEIVAQNENSPACMATTKEIDADIAAIESSLLEDY